MTLTRRLMLGAFAAPMLASCSANLASATIPVTLAAAQQEALAILTAFTTIDTSVAPTLSAGTQAVFASAVSIAKTAVDAFVAVPAGGSYLQGAQAVIAGLTPLVGLLPLPAGTVLAITEGLTLVAALANGLATIPVPSLSNAAVGVAPAGVIAAPIPIPLG